MGNVLQAGEGQAPTRQALLGAGTTEMQKDIAKQLTNTHTHTRQVFELSTTFYWFNLMLITITSFSCQRV